VANVTISARAGWTTFGDFQGGFEARATSDSEGKFNLTVFACPSVSLTATPPPESPLATVNIANIDVTKDKTVLIALFYKAGVLPTANFTWTPETPEVGQSITFNASSSEAGSGIIIRHKWSFGDGTYAVGKTVMHSYASPGVYTVTLNVTNSKGLWDVEQKQIHIAEIGPGPKPPVASFTYTPANPIVDQEITFNATTSYDPDGVIVSYNWNFGDGITTTTSDPLITHSYSEEGNYKVTLTVVDNDGESSSTSETVTVVKPLTAPIETSGLVIKAMSPVDLVVIDPDYLVISKEFNEIPNAVYMEKDLDGDGSLDDYIFIPEPKRGQYIITVIPEPGADPTATYTLEVSTRDATLLLAENVPISDIPTEPYIISPTTFETPPVTLLTIGEPQYIDQLNNVYVSSTTPFVLTAEDNPGGSGVMSTSYRIYNDTYDTGWLLYAEPFNLTGLADGTYRIDYNSTDNAGNVEPTNTVIVILDNTPPTTTLTIGEPKYVTDIACVTLETSFTLEADDDTGSGVALTEYRVDYGKWTRYTDPFTVPILGQHALEYRSVDNLGNTETPQSVSIVVGATSLTYVGDTSGQYSDPTTVRAQLINMATQQPISGKNITFTLGIQSASAITDVNGVATTSIILNQPASGYTILAVFAGGTDYLESSNSCPFTINKEDAKVEYTGDTVVPTTTKTITLRATVFDSPDSNWGDLTKIQVTFRIYTAPIDLNNPIVVVGPLYVTQTETPGIGVVVKQIPNLSENDYVVIICIEPNDYYSGPTSDPIPVTVYTPTGSFVTGGGWIWDPTGSHGNFGFIVRYTKTGTVQGHSVYIYRSGDWVYIVKSNAWIGLAIKSNYAYFEGKCTIQMYNPATGELVWSVGNYQFRVDTWDNTPNGGIDVYQIRIRDKNGVVYHEAGFSPYGYLQGGNVIIHNAGKTGTAVTIATEEERNWF
jgi:PKD repeat protein